MGGLLDFLQGASNATASTVSGPVDLLSWAMRKAGLPIPQNAVGGSQWMAEQGLTRQPQNQTAGMLGEVAGSVLPTVVAAKAPQIAGGLLQAARNAAAPRTLNPQAGAIVWHGSPHKFDKFDSSKIGTGEGAQAYGHGLYLADSPDVARAYTASNSTAVGASAHFDGVPISEIKNKTGALDWLDSYGSIANTRAALAGRKPGVLAELDDLIKSGRLTEGALYKVDLPDPAIARMLDWDAPLSQQAPEVQSALKSAGIADIENWAQTGLRGSETYKRAKMGAPSKLPLRQIDDEIFAAQRLRAAGIPGIKYLDGGSRAAGTGTRNYVVFPGEEGLLQILERNGQALR